MVGDEVGSSTVVGSAVVVGPAVVVAAVVMGSAAVKSEVVRVRSAVVCSTCHRTTCRRFCCCWFKRVGLTGVGSEVGGADVVLSYDVGFAFC